MITRIELRRFKCFDAIDLPLNRLTLLSGFNASGKSSVMQALVLLQQTMREHEWSQHLMLNGASLKLGTVRDVIGYLTVGRDIQLTLEEDNTRDIRWTFRGDSDAMSLEVFHIIAHGETSIEWLPNKSEHLRSLLPKAVLETPNGASLARRLRGLTWLSAERLGPRDIYALEDPELRPLVGQAGENTASVLYYGGDERVTGKLTRTGTPPTLLRQVEAHMSSFFPGFELDLSPVKSANAVTLGVRTSRHTEFHRPGHTGFGVTQVLPIVVAVLSAKADDLILIENPEVHLHPAGQARMGEFLAEAASAGVQMLVESHSDHVLNGIRRAVKKRRLQAGETALYFFRSRQEAEDSGLAQVESPVIDTEGNIDSWPEGFFDQFDRDMNELAGWY